MASRRVLPEATRLGRLWAPWRAAYVASAGKKSSPGKKSGAGKNSAARNGLGAGKILDAGKISSSARSSTACIFCLGQPGPKNLRERLVLYAGRLALVMLNRYPYSNGHLMVAPRRHVAALERLTREERGVIAELLALSAERLGRAYRPDGLNVGANLGRAAGAGFADHLHWHLVPRWEGDTNFMPVLASTRVLSQHLAESFKLLEPLFKAIEPALS